MSYQPNHVRRRFLMVMLVMALVAALLPTAAFAAPDNSMAAAASEARYQPRYQYDRHDRYDRQDRDRYDRYDRKPDDGRRYRCETTYRVRRGDNLTKIARHFHTSVQALVRANNIRSPNRIYAGQVLCIP